MSLNQQFRKIVSSPLPNISVEEFKLIALVIWHQGYTPNLDGLQDEELQKAGYLLPRFMRFNGVGDRRKRELMAIVAPVKLSLKNVLPSSPSAIDVEAMRFFNISHNDLDWIHPQINLT